MANNKEIAEQVLASVGGASNVKDVTHCMTRLRFMLKDDSIPKDDEVQAIPGVLKVIRGGQQYQVVIGNNVPKVYDEVVKLGGFTASAPVENDAPKAGKKLTPKQVGKNILGYMAGCMTPIIPVLLAAALFRTLSAVLGPDLLGVITPESDLYILLDFVYNAAFYFLPILVGFNAAKQLGISPMLGAFMGCILISPNFVAIAQSHTPFTVFGIPCITAEYGQTVIPVMLSVYAQSLIYKGFKKIMPDMLTTVFTPFLTMIVTIPVSLCALAPLGTIVGNAISGGLAWFGMHTGFLGVAVIAALWELLVITGMHMALMMPMMASFFETGIQSGPLLSGGFATWACYGVALGVALRAVNKDVRSNGLGCFVSGILGGITEPTVYGICMRYSRCFVAMMVGGFLGGAYAGLMNVEAYAITSPNFLALLSYAGGTTGNLINGIIASVIAFVSAAVFTYLFGLTKAEREGA